MKHKFFMTLAQALTYVIGDDGKCKQFTDKEAAETYSESLKHLWDDGLGQVTGPWIHDDPKIGKTWDVYYK